MNRPAWIAITALCLLVVLALVLSAPGRSRTAPDGPEGTAALRNFLSELGYTVADAATPPSPPGTFLLLTDLRDEEQDQSLLRWAAGGGRLVVADPGSELVRLAGAEPGGRAGLVGNALLEPGCVAPEAVGVAGLAVRASDRLLSRGGPRADSCFQGSGGAFGLVMNEGKGRVVLLGGASPLTNELLNQGDNARWALDVVGSRSAVVFGPPLPPGGAAEQVSGGFWSLLPRRAKAAVIGLCIAAVAFALVRARRLGRPVLEAPLAPIPASELVRATAALYRNARAVGFSARLMRRSTIQRVARRMGLPAATPQDEAAAWLVREMDLPERQVRDALEGPEPSDDEGLIRLAAELEGVRRRVEGSVR
jgi:hypothetical protein